MDTGLHPADSGLTALIFSFPQCFTCQHNYSMKSSPVGLILLDKVVHRVAIKSASISAFYFGIKTLVQFCLFVKPCYDTGTEF